jgi:BASS family bile acid:Na+ symporter
MSIEYADYEYGVAASQLVFAMLGMGALLNPADFRAIARCPSGVGLALLLQYGACPILAVLLNRCFDPPAGIAVGLLMVSVLPSGSLSNIFTYLARGNVALSITATTASTLASLVFTPLLIRLLASAHLTGDVRMPTGRILGDILLYLLAPLALGMCVGNCWSGRRLRFSRACIRMCLILLTILVLGSLTSGRIHLLEYGWRAPLVVILFGLLLLGPLQLPTSLLGFNRDDTVTLGIEVVMRNCNVALLLKASIFPAKTGVTDPVGDGVLFVALFYGGATLVIGALPILWRRTLCSTPR